MDFEALATECRSATFRYEAPANAISTNQVPPASAHTDTLLCQLAPVSPLSFPIFTAIFSSRESLRASPVWTQAAEAVNGCVQQLQSEVQSPGHSPSAAGDEQDTENDDGLGYTFRVDRKNPTAESLHDDFSPPKPVVADVDRATKLVDATTSVFRFLRNACAASRGNQDACQEAGLIKMVKLFCIFELGGGSDWPDGVNGVRRHVTSLCIAAFGLMSRRRH
ncbi:unnamed protein product [Phytophthora fragariaefolia]|uniref:Unnamed protein product n=1 Tax=Phytophthora fragariaefolia TaxID=1490495 RepID=A0A9W6X3M2_9STRA|nr:unnamed protein product [Phytophthora fragariaefolia]